ncbi:MAG TPA: DedA family protein [Gemmatimonadaceae bacterium]|nr:DedA family protein [Gemmatimonadaceae bacterium]
MLDWLAALPPVALYLAMAVAAAVENIFPPIPADTVVAFGSFLAARGEGTVVGAFLATLIGNMTGAAIMYGAGRKYGAERIERRLLKDKSGDAEARLRAMYDRYGLFALFISRFLPVVRAIVPVFAGALRLPPVRSLVVMGMASGIWYGLIAWLAFTAGEDWEALQEAIKRYGAIASAVGLGIVAVGVVVWLVRRRRARLSS